MIDSLHFSNGFAFVPGYLLIGFIIGALTGTVIGIFQWLVLRRLIPGAGWWIIATSIGVGIIHSVGDSTPDTVDFRLLALGSGAVVGLSQWVVLYRSSSQASWWILITLISWFIGLTVGMLIIQATGLMLFDDPEGWIMQHSVVGATTGIIVGAITGAGLIWLLEHKVSVLETKP